MNDKLFMDSKISWYKHTNKFLSIIIYFLHKRMDFLEALQTLIYIPKSLILEPILLSTILCPFY